MATAAPCGSVYARQNGASSAVYKKVSDVGGTTWVDLSDSAGATVTVDPDAGIDGDGSGGDPLVVKVDGSTIGFNGSGELEALGGGGGGGNETETTAVGAETLTNAGDLNLYSNAPYVARYTGSVWSPWGPVFPMTMPVDSDFAWVNQGTAVLTDQGALNLVMAAAASVNARLRVKSAPSTPYSITIAFYPLISAANFISAGFAWRQSSDGKLHTVACLNDGTFELAKWNSATSFSATYSGIGALGWRPGQLVWMRLSDNGTNRITQVSADALYWHTVHSVGRTDFLTADQVGFFVSANNATATNVASMTLLSWKET